MTIPPIRVVYRAENITFWTVDTAEGVYEIAVDHGDIYSATHFLRRGGTADVDDDEAREVLDAARAHYATQDHCQKEQSDDPGERTEHIDFAQDETPLASDTDA